MNDIKKLGDIFDMERYLREDCYCPGEIYSSDGFFFQVFSVNNECQFIGEASKDNILTNGNYKLLAVVAKSKEDADPQLLCICIDNDSNKIGDIIRFDATENNITLIKEVCKNNKTDKKFNEFHDGERAKSLQEVLSMADAIMID